MVMSAFEEAAKIFPTKKDGGSFRHFVNQNLGVPVLPLEHWNDSKEYFFMPS